MIRTGSAAVILVDQRQFIGASCPGKPDGEALRAANGNKAWILITASVTCKDVGNGYIFFGGLHERPGQPKQPGSHRAGPNGLRLACASGFSAERDWRKHKLVV